MKKNRFLAVVLVLSLTFLFGVGQSNAQEVGPSAAQALGTGFTYQGQLKNSGSSPITSTCAFQFTLWDALTGVSQVGSASTVTGVSVINGYFGAQVNTGSEFGANAFSGEARWLQIAVKCTGDAAYTTLSPRQPLTPAPYALALPGLYTRQNATSPNVIGGYSGNIVTSGKYGATIGGGGASGFLNSVMDNYGTVSGGRSNTASGSAAAVGGGRSNAASGSASSVGGGEFNTASQSSSTVGGGQANTASGVDSSIGGGGGNTADNGGATVGGGQSNNANGPGSTVGGGNNNTASGSYSIVGGGATNSASGNYSTVPGGSNNVASGDVSFAAGSKAKANHNGTFVWADSTNADFVSTSVNQFLIRAAGGVGINTNTTSANNLTVNGQIIAGGATAPVGYEPFVSEGSYSGISMDDRSGSTYTRWVVYPNFGSLYFYNGANKLNISNTGILTLYGLGTAGGSALCLNGSNQIAYCSSSLRYKDKVASLSLGLDTIASLRPVTFDWKGTGEHDLGFVAEEVDKVTPLLTTRNAAGEIEGVKYDRISAVLVNAMQEQQKQIAALQEQVTSLKQGTVTGSAASPLSTPWPWLALVTIILGGMLIARRQGVRS